MAASRKGKNSMTVLALSVLAEAPRVACQVHGVVAGQQGAERWLQASPGRCATANGKQTGLDVEGGRYALWKNPENPTENQQAKLAWIAATIDRLVHHAHVIPLDGDSYRTRAHRTPPPPAALKTTK